MCGPSREPRCSGEFVVAKQRTSQMVPVVLPQVRVQLVIAEELENVAVKMVGAGLEGGIDDAAQIISEFSGRVGRDQVEFLNGIRLGA